MKKLLPTSSPQANLLGHFSHRDFRWSPLPGSKGQGMTEYVLLVFLIALLAYIAVETFGKRIRYGFISAGNKVSGICDENPGIQNPK